MLYLTVTTATQGNRKNDFCHAQDGEPVTFGFECDGEKIDGRCGCRRSLCGVNSHKGTTTMTVADVDEAALREALRDHLTTNWSFSEAEAADMIRIELEDITQIANHFASGVTIERRGDKFQERR